MVEFKWTSHLNNKVNKQFRVVRTMVRRAPDDSGEIWRLPESRWAPLPAKNTSKRQLPPEKLSPNHLVGLFMTSSFIVSPVPCGWVAYLLSSISPNKTLFTLVVYRQYRDVLYIFVVPVLYIKICLSSSFAYSK